MPPADETHRYRAGTMTSDGDGDCAGARPSVLAPLAIAAGAAPFAVAGTTTKGRLALRPVAGSRADG